MRMPEIEDRIGSDRSSDLWRCATHSLCPAGGGTDDSLGGGGSAERLVGVNWGRIGRGLEQKMVRGSPESWDSDSSDSDSDSDDKVKKGVAKNDEDIEEEAEQVPPWIRYMPRNDWTMSVEIPRDRVSGVELEDNGAILKEYVERAGDFGSKSKAIITKPIPKSSNPFSAEKVLTRARVRREALAVKSSAGSAGAGASFGRGGGGGGGGNGGGGGGYGGGNRW